MADSQKQNSNAGNVLGLAIGLISAASPVVIEFIKRFPKESKADEVLTPVPALYAKGFPLTVEQASIKLSSEGFGVIASELTLREANPKYRECFPMQVVSSDPKSHTKKKPGTIVTIRYVTQEVIEESQKLFDEAEKKKADEKGRRLETRQKQVEQVKQKTTEVVGKTRDNFGKIFANRGRKDKKHEQE